MAKGKNRPNRHNGQNQQSSDQNEHHPGTLAEQVRELMGVAASGATRDDQLAVTALPLPDPELSAADLTKQAWETLALLKEQLQRSEAEQREIEHHSKEIKKQKESLDDHQSKIREKEKTLEEKESDLLKKEEEIICRELDADAGFSQRNRQALTQLEVEAEAIRKQIAQARQKIAEERAAFEAELREQRDVADAEIATTRADLERERAALAAECKKLRKARRDLEQDQELLLEDRQAFGDKVEQRAAREIETRDGEIQALKERLAAARTRCDQLSQQISEREEADRQFGKMTPEEIRRHFQRLKQENEKLREQLGKRMSADATQRLEALERQKEQWESDRQQLLAELAEARQEASRKRIAVTELESLRDHKKSLEVTNELLRETNQQLREEVDELITGREGKSPFPSCSAMDVNTDLQEAPSTIDAIRDLTAFAEEIRHRMSWDPRTGKELFYAAEDIRSFLGGLAMSRLHLLQGISGTGKTSLPLAFARAIGARCELIEIQAGWRDRQDLLGHFNTFERRYHETSFLQALYRAGCPRFRDTPFIIVLDEMNLSHPEQYFADLLSALEQDQNFQRLHLMTAAVEAAPRLFSEGGMALPLPANVWFVGTANHDETTKDFADKTYDRAHVMELPRHREAFKRQDLKLRDPYSLAALAGAFESAKTEHEEEADHAYGFLQTHLGDLLGRKFGVGWGNRLERQMSHYVPVIIAAGGNIGEATDRILASKLLRKIRDRYDNRPEDLIELRDLIERKWKAELYSKSLPDRSLSLLQNELHRLGHDEG